MGRERGNLGKLDWSGLCKGRGTVERGVGREGLGEE